MADTQANDNNSCVVCFKNVLCYSIGECDHPVCYECSTRMRVLCLQNECPICRQDLARVVFTESIQPYKELRNKAFSDRLFERQFKIAFCSEEIKNAYERLLENSCKLCPKLTPFRNFTALSEHMRKVHERYYCDLCVKHLKIFTSERKCYTRSELAHHRRKGDTDDTSHRGHPLCEFCEERFMDADELYRHLRKDHLFCHLCDADGRNHYYASHQALALHFKTEHYLCEEGECAGQHLTAVYRSEIDLKAHKATVHGKGLARAAARQARTLELQFNITPHPVVQRAPRSSEPTEPPIAAAPVTAPRIDTGSVEQFPRLSAVAPTPLFVPTSTVKSYKGMGSEGLARTDRNFPALDGNAPSASSAPSAAVLKNSKPSVYTIQVHSQPTSASNFRLTQTSGNRISIPPQQKKTHLSDDDFPSLSITKDAHPNIGAASIQPPKVALVNGQEMQALKKSQGHQQHKKPQLSTEAFPALSTTSVPAAPPQWITVTKSKDKNKPKHEPPQKPRPVSFNAIAEFPTLPANTAKSKLKKQSQPQSVPNQTDNGVKPNSKKEKKKQVNGPKKEISSDCNNINGFVDDKRSDRDSISLNNNNNNYCNGQYSSNVDIKPKTSIETTSTIPVNADRRRNGDFSMKAKDYPPLSRRAPAPAPAPAPALAFAAVARPAPPPCDGLTFTNSAGETFPAPLHDYVPPPDFEKRNVALVARFAEALGSLEAVDEFKQASRAFREGRMSADEFYARCEAVMGAHVDAEFPELVALLPDIAKQQELVLGRRARAALAVCAACGQLLAREDRLAHDAAHWPALSR